MGIESRNAGGLPPPSPESVREQLEKILSSSAFATALRSRRFLAYIVEEALAGRADGIKELVLGIEVFDRHDNFDPKLDTIVRVEAGKLRKRLQEYYGNEGAGDPMRITVPKGCYVPEFQAASPALPAPRPRRFGRFLPLVLLAPIVFAGWWAVRRVSAKPPVAPSIAVLPFLNFSPDPTNEYLADGIAEELTDALCHAGGIRVASRTSAFSFKGKQVDAHEIGARLHVAFIVEGSVRRDGDLLRVTTQLIRVDDGYHVWSGSLDRRLKDVLAVQQEIAASVVSALKVKLTGTQERRLKKNHTASQDAFDLYLRGLHVMDRLASPDIAPAERLFRKSLAADPGYALPYVALAQLYMYANIWASRPASDLASKATEAIHRALALDDELAEAHAILGSLAARHEYDWAAAERHLRHALELNPYSAVAHNELAQNVLAPQGRWREARDENRRAIELDPMSGTFAAGEMWLDYLERRNEDVLARFRNLPAAAQANPMNLSTMATARAAMGDYHGAIDAFERARKLDQSPLILAFIGYVQARAGHTAAARRVLAELTARGQTGFVSPVCFATVYIGLRENESAIRYLETARAQQESFLIFAGVDSFFDPIRSDPRFRTLLTELHLDQ